MSGKQIRANTNDRVAEAQSHCGFQPIRYYLLKLSQNDDEQKQRDKNEVINGKNKKGMNYLAHAYLSFGNANILVGNMISDFVKGKQKFTYSEGIQKGISLHRMIDEFTDAHEATHAARQFFKPAVGLYSGAFTDVVYDHFLALDETEHTQQQLLSFTVRTYQTLDDYVDVMPQRFAQMFPYMKLQNWLYNYRTIDGMNKSFGGVVRRAVYLNNSVAAFDAFLKHYDELKACYEAFFLHVKKWAKTNLDVLLRDE